MIRELGFQNSLDKYRFYEFILNNKNIHLLLENRTNPLRQKRSESRKLDQELEDSFEEIFAQDMFNLNKCNILWYFEIQKPKKFDLGLLICEKMMNKLELRPYLAEIVILKLAQLLMSDFTLYHDWREDIRACYNDLFNIKKMEEFALKSEEEQEEEEVRHNMMLAEKKNLEKKKRGGYWPVEDKIIFSRDNNKEYR